VVEKIKKYSVEMCNCFLGEHMETVERSDGDFFKVEDVEPILNSLQQLKAEIAAIEIELRNVDGATDVDMNNIAQYCHRLRQLSAVQ